MKTPFNLLSLWTGTVGRTARPFLYEARPARRLLGLGLGLALALTTAACDDDGGLPIACSGPAACPPPSNSIGWAVQIWPSSSTNATASAQQLPPYEVPQLLFDRGGSAELHLRAPAEVQGSVVTAEALPLARAHVLAQLPSAILGQSAYTFDTLTSDRPLGGWSMRLPVPPRPTDQVYRFWVGFDDAAQSSLYTPLWSERAITGDLTLPLRLRALTELAVLTGRVLDPLGDGVAGLTVQVFDSRGQIVSSTAVTQSAQAGLGGAFRVLVDPTLSAEPTASLRLIARPGPQSLGLPVLELPLAPLKAGLALPLELRMPPARKPLLFQLPIKGLSSSGTMLDVAGARVQAQVVLDDKSLPAGERAIYTATADTNSDGLAKLSLIPAPTPGPGNLTYRVTVTSPARTPFASTQQDVQIGPSEGLLAPLQLAMRAQLTGRLLDASGAPVPSAQVVAQSIVRTDTTGVPVDPGTTDPAPPQTTTDQDGRFALRLDAGDYDVDFLPKAGTAPRSSLDNQRITSFDLDLGDVRLPRIALGKLVVLDPSGAPLPGAKLRIFQLPDTSPKFGFACMPGLPCSRAAKLRAEAFVDSKGRAQFLLPDSAPAANLQPPPLLN